MHIAFLHAPFDASSPFHAEYALSLGEALLAEGHDVMLYSGASVQKRTPVRVCTVPVRGSHALAASSWWIELLGRLLADDIDILHVQSEGVLRRLRPLRLLKKHVRIVHTVHEGDLCSPQTLVSVPHLVVAGSHHLYCRFERSNIEALVCVPPGMEAGGTRKSGSLSDVGLSRRGYLVVLSDGTQESGAHYALQALHGISGDFRVVVLADRFDATYLRDLQGLSSMDDRTQYLEGQDASARRELFSHALLVVYASDVPGVPRALYEAMGTNCPVLLSDVPENTAAAGKQGYVFRAGDIGHARLRLKQMLLKQPVARERAREAREFIEETLTWSEAAKRMLAAYDRIRL